jgi:uncharacterized protein DUF6306
MDAALERMLNLLLESERAGVVVLDSLAGEVKHPDLKELLLDARGEEGHNAATLERLVREGGGTPSTAVGPFAGKVAAVGNTRGRLALLIRGQEWVARKIEETLALAPESGTIRESLQRMANRHRHEIEWGRAELIRLMDTVDSNLHS